MRPDPLVSVIVIFLNEEQFLREAIESVFAQTYHRWELILVDDGSTDASTSIACRYAEEYPEKARYFEHRAHQNRGMSASRNVGISNAAGDYVAFLDGDDVWLPIKLEQQVKLLESRPEVGMVFAQTQWWYSWTRKHEDMDRDFVHELGVPASKILKPPELLIHFLPNESLSPCTCSVLLRRRVVEQVTGFEEIFTGLYEDQAFFAKISLTTPMIALSTCVAKYRQHENSNCAIAEKKREYQKVRETFLNWLMNYINSHNVESQEVRQALEREMKKNRFLFFDGLYDRVHTGTPGRIYRSILELRLRWRALPIFRHLRLLQLRRFQPLYYGRQRGTPIVRYYWDHFLRQYKTDIYGKVLEIGTTATVRQYGAGNIIWADAIDLTAHSSEVTVVSDLSRADDVASDQYDCFVNQFTSHLIYDIDAALYHSIRILKPGGVLLINFPCVDYYFPRGLDMGTGNPLFMYWWFTPVQVENLLRRSGLCDDDYKLKCYGNLFARVAYQMNLPAEELTQPELTYLDVGHPILICVRVVKPRHWVTLRPVYRDAWQPHVNAPKWNSEMGHYAE